MHVLQKEKTGNQSLERAVPFDSSTIDLTPYKESPTQRSAAATDASEIPGPLSLLLYPISSEEEGSLASSSKPLF